MLFNSYEFVIFLPVAVAVNYILPKKVRYIWLLIASYYYYMCWNAKYALLILTSTVVTYACGLALERFKDDESGTARKKLAVALSLVINLGILFVFKYLGFAQDTAEKLMSALNVTVNMRHVDLVLPVGISFYTFQALGYTIDVYRGEVKAERNFLKYALFVSFFPQLVAGPIERSKNLLTQLENPAKLTYDGFRDAVLMILRGYFMKIVVADRIAIFVDTVYADIGAFPGWYLIVATMLFAVQIYCDFGGYTMIAMGSAKLLGIRLMENFNAPYFSTSVAQFWRNWHISLTSWFRDYVYIPLGGNRRGKARKYLNIMIVFLLSGLWHGAKVSFVIWGGLNGLYQIAGETIKPAREKFAKRLGLNKEAFGDRLLAGLVTFILVDFSWIFFRADGASEAVKAIKSIVHADNMHILVDGSLYNCGLNRQNFALMLISIGILAALDFLKHKRVETRDVLARQSWWFRCVYIAVAVLFILLFGVWGPGYNAASFIYFQF